ncbi:lycopene cyclase family protein [Streptomyces zingiberis]|uniref:Lycopene cyclase n=1 Tax=Streptomyces zingiberis TaxID=2053010 RepID=A0ABX1BRG0_9ACTN|nr:lycopene cyclase family protein [Streptomyces zingiberis]NJP99020.1 lycopene cyclase [Streptomyces zingiberis]
MYDTEVAIVGAGAAGLSLAYRLSAEKPGGRLGPEVTLVDAPPGPLRPPERTWCFWEEPGGEYDDVLTASWDRLRVRGPAGEEITGTTAPLRYKMLRSGDFEAEVGRRLGRSPFLRPVSARVTEVAALGQGAEVRGTGADGEPLRLRARWVFDSRPPRGLPPARTTLLQHFRGWFLRAERPVFDPGTADLMDFRTPQPAHGLSFGYVLPTSPYEALVEYTEFSRSVLTPEGYERALRHYTREVLGVDRYEVTGTEQGVIPMTDGRYPRQAAPAVFRIGTAGGATRPSTGYTFAAVQRQTRAIAAAYHQGRTPLPPPPHSPWSRAMDAVLLRALDSGRVDGAAFFTGLFRRVPAERLLRFLDGRTRIPEDLAIGLRTPVGPMLRTAVEVPWLRRRPSPAGNGDP